MMTGLSEYELKRLDNIRNNQKILQSLQIPKLNIPDAVKKSDVKTKSIVRPRVKQSKDVQEPVRKSSRLIEKQTGLSLVESEPRPEPVKKERIPRPPRITSKVPFAPQVGASKDFFDCFQGADLDYNGTGHASNITGFQPFETRNEHCVIKVARDRIYSMAVHPMTSKIVACAGTKEGELAFWECSDVLDSRYKVNDEWTPKAFLFAPHNGAISNLKFWQGKLLTTSYDGSYLLMDLDTGTFDPWFQMLGRDAVVTGFDVYDSTAYHSDTNGVVRLTDLRTMKEIASVTLHEAKIGGVSVSNDGCLLATCSNDRSIAIWDVRNLNEKKKAIQSFEYKNAVTAVNFHPTLSRTFASTCYDNHVRIHNVNQGDSVEIPHNNQTGRWITLFKAVWDPKSSDEKNSLLAIGNMEQRGVDLYNLKGEHEQCATSPWLTAQPAVNAFHPRLDLIFSGNASGKMVVWSR